MNLQTPLRSFAASCARIPLLLLLGSVLVPGHLAAQSFPDSTRPPLQTRASFERNVNTFTWDLGGLLYFRGSNARVYSEERFLRSLIRTDSDYLKDEQNFLFLCGYTLGEEWELQASARNFFYSDQRSRGLNDITTNTPLLGLSWRPSRAFRLGSFAGWTFDRQQGMLDDGFAYRVEAFLEDLALDDVRASGTAFSSADLIHPRMEQDHRVSASVITPFADAGVNTASGGFRSSRRDFYIGPSSDPSNQPSIESRLEDQLSLGDVLRLRMFENVEMQMSGALAQKNIARRISQTSADAAGLLVYPSDISEFRLDAGALLRYERAGTEMSIRMDFSERTETHSISPVSDGSAMEYLIRKELESQKNTAIQQTLLAVYLRDRFGDKDSVFLSASTLKMQYDTPSPLNLDDRDEVYFLGNIRWVHCFTPAFSAALLGDVTLRHTVYLWSQRSANNNWNRVYRLSPSTVFRLPWLATRNGADVVANYTVYDFDQPGEQRQSYALRQLTLTDSTEIALASRNVWAVVHAHVRYYERGEMYWSDFSMRPISRFTERTIGVYLEYRFFPDDRGHWLRAAAGLRSFAQDRYDVRSSGDVLAGSLRTWGPAAQISMQVDRETMLLCDGWYQITDVPGQARSVTPNVQLQMMWTL